MLTSGSLFSGCGGLDLGVAAAFGGARLAFVADVCKHTKTGVGHHDPCRAPCSILAHRFPDVPNLGDITAVDWEAVEPVDILTGGFPCQDVSHAGRRAGLIRGETRTGLWAEMLRGIATMRPRLVVAENVRGLLSARADSDVEPCPWCMGDADDQPPMRALGAVLADLADIGYDAAWCGLRAADVGAAHGRFRVFVLAWPRSAQDADRLGEPDRTTSPLSESWSRPSLRSDGPDSGANAGLTLLPTPACNDMGEGKTVERWDEWTDDMKAKHGNGNGHGKSLAIEAQRLLQTPSVADVTGGHETRGGARSGELLLNGQAKQMDGGKWGDYAPAIARWERVLNRPAPDPTQTSSKGNPQLSARFTEFLMGLDDGWITGVPGITRNEALKACGNGVVPLQAEAAIRWLWQYVPESVRADLLGVAA